MTGTSEPLFASAHAALAFAFNYSKQQYDRPMINRIATSSTGQKGKGLSGTDGAGQAGMIRAELAKLTVLEQAVLTLSIAERQIPCECHAACCAGYKPNPEWMDALSVISSAAAAEALSGCISNGRLRAGLIQKLFGVKVSLVDLAERCHVDADTAGSHHLKLKRWLFGHASPGSLAVGTGLHQRALNAITRRLLACGWIGSPGGAA
ncbi:hypothetical protein ACOTHZ_11205 [Achromobacter xylosoxidans]